MKICKNCNESVVHEFSHRTSRGKKNATLETIKSATRKVYVDQTGRQWTDATCPDCSGKHSKKKQGLSAKPKTKRKCTICKEHLPEGRRFMHEKCQSIASDLYYDMDDAYGICA